MHAVIFFAEIVIAGTEIDSSFFLKKRFDKYHGGGAIRLANKKEE